MPFVIPNTADVGAVAAQAAPDKVDFDIITAASQGTGVVSGCAVTVSTLLTLNVASGVVAVLGAPATVTSGTVTIGTADLTNPRFDLVVANSSGTKSVTAGTAAASPVFPSIPASSVVLAAVYVPALLTTVLSGDITDKRTPVLGYSTTNPAALGTAAPGTATTWARSDHVHTLPTSVTRQILTVGSGTYTTPAGCTAIFVEVQAGGGGAGSVSGSGSNAAGSSGGGPGGYSAKLIAAPAATYAYVAGAKGTAGAAGNNVGNVGSDSTFGAGGGLITAKGGSAGTGMAFGTGAAAVSGATSAAAGTGGDVNYGGSSAGPGLRLSGSVAVSGEGGPSHLGPGGRGRASAGDGEAGLSPGSGGGGCVSTASNQTGGDGADGVLYVTEYY